MVISDYLLQKTDRYTLEYDTKLKKNTYKKNTIPMYINTSKKKEIK